MNFSHGFDELSKVHDEFIKSGSKTKQFSSKTNKNINIFIRSAWTALGLNVLEELYLSLLVWHAIVLEELYLSLPVLYMSIDWDLLVAFWLVCVLKDFYLSLPVLYLPGVMCLSLSVSWYLCHLWLYMWCHSKKSRCRYRFRTLCFLTAALWITSRWFI